MDLKATYNKIAKDWHQDHASDDWWVEGIGQFSDLLPQGGSVLDAGSGGGAKSRYFVGRGLQVTGVDFSESLISIARKEVPGAEFHTLDIRDVKTLNHQFDGIFFQAVLLHFPKNESVGILSSLLRVLKPQGLIHVSVKEIKPGQSEEEMKKENDYGYSYERFFRYFTEQEVITLLEEQGLKIVSSEVTPAGKTNWIQVIAKKP